MDWGDVVEIAQKNPKFRRKIQHIYRRNFTHKCPVCGRLTRASVCVFCRRKIRKSLMEDDGVEV